MIISCSGEKTEYIIVATSKYYRKTVWCLHLICSFLSLQSSALYRITTWSDIAMTNFLANFSMYQHNIHVPCTIFCKQVSNWKRSSVSSDFVYTWHVCTCHIHAVKQQCSFWCFHIYLSCFSHFSTTGLLRCDHWVRHSQQLYKKIDCVTSNQDFNSTT